MYAWVFCVLFYVLQPDGSSKLAYNVTSYKDKTEEQSEVLCEAALMDMSRKANLGFHAYCARVPLGDPD